MFSLGIEPSITSTNGSAASPRAAARNGVRNSSPPSVGESTLLCRLTFGIPGIAPSRTSSIDGWPAAVIETVTVAAHPLRDPEDVDLLNSRPLGAPSIVNASTSNSSPRTSSTSRLPQRAHASGKPGNSLSVPHTRQMPAAGTSSITSVGALRERPLGDEAEREGQRVGHDLPEVPDLDLHRLDPPPIGVGAGDAHHGVGDRELMHQQILGRGSPTSSSITRLPPKLVSTSTIPGGSVLISPMSAACARSAAARPGPRPRARARRGR